MDILRKTITFFFRSIWIAVLLLPLHGCGQQQGNQADQGTRSAAGNALGVVNGAPVYEQAFRQRIQQQQASLPSVLGSMDGEVSVALKRKVVWELIDEKLLSEEAARRDITITDAELAQALTAFEASFASHQAFQDYLASYPCGLTSLKNDQRISLLRSRLAGVPPAVSDDDVAQYYEQHKDLYQHPAYLVADEIVLLNRARRDEAAELSTLRQRILNQGLSFQHQARKHSEGDTAQRGGDMGRVTSNSVQPEIWNAVCTLGEGQISSPILLSDRTLLVRVRERVAASSKSLSQVSAEIRKQLTRRLQSAQEAELVAGLRANAAVHNRFEESEQSHVNQPAAMTLGAGVSAQDLLGQNLKQGGTALLNRPGS
jgi:parvulin-like peptidyl-prolyl isomerase